MINHFYSVLFNRAEQPPSGIYVPLTEPLRLQDAVETAIVSLRGSTAASADAFAIHALKLVEHSTYRNDITARDTRITYRLQDHGVVDQNSVTMIGQIMQLRPDVLGLIFRARPEIGVTYRNSRILQEAAAGVLTGLVTIISDYADV